MAELKKYEGGIDYKAEPYTNGVLENSLQAILEKQTKIEKKIEMILHYGRIIIKSSDPDIVKKYFKSKKIIYDEDRNTPPDEIKYIIKEKLETLSNKKIKRMLRHFKIKSWKILDLGELNAKPLKRISKTILEEEQNKQIHKKEIID
ncbi:MAG: hypothetical protein PHG82_03200 [Candidatus Gracilibacteria bacterium]|nr:hypothetical protein [Candidatus Gracilibacteria bacterium]